MQISPIFKSGHKHTLTHTHVFLDSLEPRLRLTDNILDGKTVSALEWPIHPLAGAGLSGALGSSLVSH